MLMFINECRNQLYLFAGIGESGAFVELLGSDSMSAPPTDTAFNNNIDVGWYFMVIIDVISIIYMLHTEMEYHDGDYYR